MKALHHLFFSEVVRPVHGLFETSDGNPEGRACLPAAISSSSTSIAGFDPRLSSLEMVGRALVKCAFDGRRALPRFAPFLFTYLAHGEQCSSSRGSGGDGRAAGGGLGSGSGGSGTGAQGLRPTLRDLRGFDAHLARQAERIMVAGSIDGWGLDFEQVGDVASEPVTDKTKSLFVKRFIWYHLVGKRAEALQALRQGFMAALHDVAPAAAPLLRLLGPTDLRLLLVGPEELDAEAVIAMLRFTGGVSAAVRDTLRSWLRALSEDLLRRFLSYVTEEEDTEDRLINVRHMQHWTPETVPQAHTCFNTLDVPPLTTVELFQSRLNYFLFNANDYGRT